MSESKQRIFVFDNVKALLIVLVVLGHAADYYTTQFESMRMFYFYIYLFHMPLFIFIAGLFSKSTILKDPFRIEKIANFLILYFILEIIFYVVIHFWLGHTSFAFNPFVEDGVPWFMFAMAVWLCIGRLLRNVRAFIVIPISIILALCVGYTHIGDLFVLSRIITFFPFFMLGFYVQPKELVASLTSPELKIISVISLILIAFTIYFNIDGLYEMRSLLSGRNPYDRVGIDLGITGSGAVMRLLMMIVTICMSISVMALMTHKQTWFTILGTRSLAIYFFHRPILFVYHHYQLNDYVKEAFPHIWLYVYLSFFLVVSILLAATPFEKALFTIQAAVERFVRSVKNNQKSITH